MELKLTAHELHAFLEEVFPQLGGRIRAVDVKPGTLTAEMRAAEQDLRPGGTVSGPAMFTLADCAFYMAVLSVIGKEALTVTTSCSINFLRKPAPGSLFADARILKLGKRLAVGDVLIYSDAPARPVAQASLTYAIPPAK
ncbi:MAG: PaaI family thioesterase [Pseudomonadota bacterium]